jgi:hypothetical protein
LVVQILGLIKQEVGGKLLVFVTRKVSLNHEVALETEATQALNSLALLFGDRDGLGAWGQRRILVSIFREQLQELFRVRCNHLRQLGVTGADLLQDRLKHLRLLLYDLSKLLELGVVAQEVKAVRIECATGATCSSARASTT